MQYITTYESFSPDGLIMINENKITTWVEKNFDKLTTFFDKAEVEMGNQIQKADIKENSKKAIGNINKIIDKIDGGLKDKDIMNKIAKYVNVGAGLSLVSSLVSLVQLNLGMFAGFMQAAILLYLLRYVVKFISDPEMTIAGELAKSIRGLVGFFTKLFVGIRI